MTHPKSSGRSDRKWKAMVAWAKANLPPYCHICGGWIDVTLHHNDARAFTLDHLDAMGNGGDPHGKTAPAHRSCNSARGKRPVQSRERPKGSGVF